ncbi:cation:proton antiporter [Coxiella burnetii]|uniref:cation:proton antiporter n=1 Tax=Coxiella burnetii TaxID=777 RepID=UPI000410A29B|nr:sodium:proton antiporter [Coxiella burnetii]MDE3400486.1 sodium:proton antiporter [Coxiella burnetii]POZ76370.1 sodium:proton antiporter [Coxiella burnetii]
MDIYTLGSIVLTFAVLIAYVNHRFIRMQSTIAIMSASLLLSAIFIIFHHFHIANIGQLTENVIENIDFPDLLLKGLLNFLLFAGALTIDFNMLKAQKWEIGMLASLSTIVSTVLIAFILYYFLQFLHLDLPFLYCLLFGALISPSDPIAVLATFKQLGAPERLTACVAGESLFNDGVGIVLFITFYALTVNHIPATIEKISLLFLRQAVGGIIYGLLLGFITTQLLKSVKDYSLSILLTLAAVTGGYQLALALGISGPLAMVITGIMVGAYIRRDQDETHKKKTKALETFWEVIDEVLNAILFLLIGFELLAIKASTLQIVAILLTIPLVLLVRLITVSIPIKFIQLKRNHNPYIISILTWGGLRGGLAVALALSLPFNEYRNFILGMTYGVVIFSIIVQGLTIKPLTRLARRSHEG